MEMEGYKQEFNIGAEDADKVFINVYEWEHCDRDEAGGLLTGIERKRTFSLGELMEFQRACERWGVIKHEENIFDEKKKYRKISKKIINDTAMNMIEAVEMLEFDEVYRGKRLSPDAQEYKRQVIKLFEKYLIKD